GYVLDADLQEQFPPAGRSGGQQDTWKFCHAFYCSWLRSPQIRDASDAAAGTSTARQRHWTAHPAGTACRTPPPVRLRFSSSKSSSGAGLRTPESPRSAATAKTCAGAGAGSG